MALPRFQLKMFGHSPWGKALPRPQFVLVDSTFIDSTVPSVTGVEKSLGKRGGDAVAVLLSRQCYASALCSCPFVPATQGQKASRLFSLQLPNLHTFITLSLFNVLAVLALKFIRRYCCCLNH